MQKSGCPIVTAATILQDRLGKWLLWIVQDAVFNRGGDVSLMSEFQTCKFGIAVDSVSKWHQHPDGQPGIQAIYLHDEDDTVIPLQTWGALSMFQHWTPMTKDLRTLPHRYVMPPGPWKPQSFYNGQPPIPMLNDSIDYLSTQEGINHPMTEELKRELPLFNPITHNPIYNSILHASPAETLNKPFFMDTYQHKNKQKHLHMTTRIHITKLHLTSMRNIGWVGLFICQLIIHSTYMNPW